MFLHILDKNNTRSMEGRILMHTLRILYFCGIRSCEVSIYPNFQLAYLRYQCKNILSGLEMLSYIPDENCRQCMLGRILMHTFRTRFN